MTAALYVYPCVQLSRRLHAYFLVGGNKVKFRRLFKSISLPSLFLLTLSIAVAPCGALGIVAAEADGGAISLPEETVVGEGLFEDKLMLSPGTVSVIRPEDMKGESKSLPDLLKRVPGLHIMEARGRGAYTIATVRGSTASQVTVFVDGVMMNLGMEGAVDLTTIPVDNVEKIEVYRGYIPARFAGAAMGGVINIVTKDPYRTEGEISAGGGSFGRRNAGVALSRKLGDGKIFVGANYNKSDGDFKYDNDNGTEYNLKDDYKTKRQNNSYENKDVLIKWVNSDWRVRLGWKNSYRDQPYKAAGNDRPDSKVGGRLDTEQWTFSVGRRFKSGNVSWGLNAEYLYQSREFENPANSVGALRHYQNQFDTERFGFAVDASVPIGDRHLLEFMGDYARETLEITGDRFGFLPPIAHIGRDSYNLQLQDSIALDKDATFWLTPIVRYNYMDGTGEFSWGIALNKTIKEGWVLKATYGTYNRAPKLFEQYGDGATIVPNSEPLKWEEGTQYDIGVSYTGKYKDADFRFDLAYFNKDVDNLIELVYVSPVMARFINVGSAEMSGIEFEAALLWRDWELTASATWLHAMNTTKKVFGFRDGMRLPHKPEYEGFVRLTRNMKKGRLSAFAEVHYCGPNYFDSIETVEMDRFVTANVGLKWKITDSVKLSIGVDDVFDELSDVKLRPVLNGPVSMLWYPLQGRTFYASLTWIF
jgi:vitamin B12 transporter